MITGCGMKRVAIALLLAVALLPALAGCNKKAEVDTPEAGQVTTETASEPTPTESYDPIPVAGEGESAAAAALPALVQAEKKSGDTSVDWATVEKTEPQLVAYLVRVDLNGEVALFEVRADGVAHNLYAYQRAFDSGSIIWTPAADVQGATAAATSDGEKQAVASVTAVMTDAFPESQFAVSIHGYRFVYAAQDLSRVTFEVAPGGSLIRVSAGS